MEKNDTYWRILNRLTKMKAFDHLPDEIAIAIKFKKHFYRNLDLRNPKTFSEKLQWLKLYDRNPLYTELVDKYRVKQYVATTIGDEYVVPTFGRWKNYAEIDFRELPEKFVLKCNHGSGDAVICKDKRSFNSVLAKEKLTAALRKDYYLISREWPYKDVDRCILAEMYLEDEKTKEARDYKYFCFDGKVKCFKIDFGRFTEHHANWYDCNGNIIPYGEKICPPCLDVKLEIPQEFQKMIELAEKLSRNIPFVRVDFYYVNGRIYFGEMTFYPASGLLQFTDEAWDLQLGKWLNLPSKTN